MDYKREIKLLSIEPRNKPRLSEVLVKLACAKCKYKEKILSLNEITRILFSIQGCRPSSWLSCFRTIPSAGATYPLEIYFISSGIEGLEEGIYSYNPKRHSLTLVYSDSSLDFSGVLVNAVYERTTGYYGSRGYMYVREEVGHAIQNAVVTSCSLGFKADVYLSESIPGKILELNNMLKGVSEALIILEPYNGEGKELRELPISIKRELSLDEAIIKRKSIRSYERKPLSLNDLNYVTYLSIYEFCEGTRTYPELNSRYRDNIILVVGEVDSIDNGIYIFRSDTGEFEVLSRGDYRRELMKASLSQRWVGEAPVSIVIVGEGDIRSEYEAGMIGQNIYLSATAIGLGTVAIGAFYDNMVREIVGVGRPLYVMPLGYPRKKLF